MTATLYGHRDFVQTTCPGNRYREWVPQLRSLIKEADMPEVNNLDESITLPPIKHENETYGVTYALPAETRTARQWLNILRQRAAYAIFAAKVYRAANRKAIEQVAAQVQDLDVSELQTKLDAVDVVVDELDDVIVRPSER